MTLGIEVTFGSKKETSAGTLKQNGIQRCTTSIMGSRLVANGFLRITRLTSRLIWRSFSKNFPSAENWPATKFTNDFMKSDPIKGWKNWTGCYAGRIANSQCAQTPNAKRQTPNA